MDRSYSLFFPLLLLLSLSYSPSMDLTTSMTTHPPPLRKSHHCLPLCATPLLFTSTPFRRPSSCRRFKLLMSIFRLVTLSELVHRRSCVLQIKVLMNPGRWCRGVNHHQIRWTYTELSNFRLNFHEGLLSSKIILLGSFCKNILIRVLLKSVLKVKISGYFSYCRFTGYKIQGL